MCAHMIHAYYNMFLTCKYYLGKETEKKKDYFLNLASVQTILFSKWSTVSPLGQAPVFMSL